MNTQTQQAHILTHLKAGLTLTPLEALNKFGCFRLGARIYDLKQSGHQISKQMVDVEARNGETTRVAEYKLDAS